RKSFCSRFATSAGSPFCAWEPEDHLPRGQLNLSHPLRHQRIILDISKGFFEVEQSLSSKTKHFRLLSYLCCQTQIQSLRRIDGNGDVTHLFSLLPDSCEQELTGHQRTEKDRKSIQ
ncbi:MAG: hypothetical protein ACJ8CB_08275, partial [Ktedonobacteraceae bacterium]